MKLELNTELPIVFTTEYSNQFKPVPAYLLGVVEGNPYVLPLGSNKPELRSYWKTREDFFAAQKAKIAAKRKELDDWEKSLAKEESGK